MRDLFVYRPLEEAPSRARAESEARLDGLAPTRFDPSLASASVKDPFEGDQDCTCLTWLGVRHHADPACAYHGGNR